MITEREEAAAREMFLTEGWKDLVADLEDQLDLCTIDNCHTLEELHFTKGRAAVLQMILNYENYILRLAEQEELDDTLQ